MKMFRTFVWGEATDFVELVPTHPERYFILAHGNQATGRG